MKIGIFGGSFDPIHLGHLALAENARLLAKLDKIIFVPAGRPPHKARCHASGKDRLRMVRIATSRNPNLLVDNFEISKPNRASYTYVTIRHFRKKYPKDKLYFLIGSDSLAEIPSWKKGWAMARLCSFLVGRRTTEKKPRIPEKTKNRIEFMSTPLIDISSTEIRGKIKNKKSMKNLVPDAVSKYIKKRRLYT